MIKKEKILAYLEQNAKFTAKEIANALDYDVKEVADIINQCEEDGTILAYKALINWDKTEREHVSAIIEIKVQTRKDDGFDSVAKQICAFSEVSSLHLMSGGFDLAATIEGKSMKEVALFVYEKLAVIDGVTGTATHFVLNKYKDKNVVFDAEEQDNREMFEV